VDEPRYRNLGRLRGAALCAALASSQLSLWRSCAP
jgi:hypothetical protein